MIITKDVPGTLIIKEYSKEKIVCIIRSKQTNSERAAWHKEGYTPLEQAALPEEWQNWLAATYKTIQGLGNELSADSYALTFEVRLADLNDQTACIEIPKLLLEYLSN